MSADLTTPGPAATTPPAAGPALRLTPLLFAALAGTMAMMAYVAVIGPAARQLGLPEWVAGLSITAGGFFWMALARWWGGVSDRHGRKRVLLAGFCVFTLTYLVLAVGIDLALHQKIGALAATVLLIATRSLIGGFYAAVPPSAAAFIADHTTPAERPSRMAKLGTANAVGMVAGPAVAGGIAAYDLSLALYAAAALPAIAMLVVWFGLPQQAAPAATGGPKPKTSVTLFDPRLRLASLTALIGMSAVAVAQVLVGFFAIDRLGLEPQAGARTAGLALAAVGVALIVSQQFVMRLKQVPLNRWVWVGALIAGSGFSGVVLVQSQATLLACYGVAAFGMGFIFPSFQAMAANAVQKHEQGAAAGTVSAAQGLGMVLSPLAGTLLYRIAPAAPYLIVGGLLLCLSLYVATRPAAPTAH
ncbi:MFS transporter [Hydrogenophaga palleronii]|uniref:MFS transporter n=1 Tax=Hydrogenophaga palleronii TaxID=65655 RepID=UPI0008249875|nr:MFS transporter [Hydrogenophaga palleronii]